MADESTQSNEQSANYGSTPREILTNQARDQESIMILDRALARDQERRAEFMREQEREFIDAKDKRRTLIETMMLGHAEDLRKQGVPDNELIEGVMAAFFNASPQEVFPEIAEELRQERYAMPLDEDLRFLAENAPDAFEDDYAERERIVRIDAQFREQKGLPSLSQDIKKVWSDPETWGKILKYGSYGVMAAVLIGSGGAAAPGMLASKAAMRMMPHLGKAVEQGASLAGRTLVRHGFISPKTYAAATEKLLALGNEAKTNKYMKAGRFALFGAVAVAAGAAGADAAGLFDGFGGESQSPGEPAPEDGTTQQADGSALQADGTTLQADGTTQQAEGSAQQTPGTEQSGTQSETPSSEGAAESGARRGGWTAPNVLNGSGTAGGWTAPNVLNGSGTAGGWTAPNVLNGGAEAADAMETSAAEASYTSSEDPSQQESPENHGNSTAAPPSIPAADLIQSMREAGLSTTQIEMFYQSTDLSAAELADIVELSGQPARVMQVLASQGVDVSTLPITAAEATNAAPEYFAIETEISAAIEVTVQKGDTLSDIIAEQCRAQGIKPSPEMLYGNGITPGLIEQIAQHNPHISSPDVIYPGETITLPIELLTGGSVSDPTLSAEAPKSSEDLTSPTASHENIDQFKASESSVMSTNAEQSHFQSATPGGAAQDLAEGRFSLNSHIDNHLGNLGSGEAPSGPTVSDVAMNSDQDSPDTSATLGVAENIASGQFDLTERVNAHLADYEPPVAQPDSAEKTTSDPALPTGGIASGLTNGSVDLADHRSDSMAVQSDILQPDQPTHDGGEGWRERLAGAFVKAKSMMASLAGSDAAGTGAAPEQPSTPSSPDVAETESRSCWELLTEAAQRLEVEQGGSLSESPADAPDPHSEKPNLRAPVQEESPGPRMYARNGPQGGPGF